MIQKIKNTFLRRFFNENASIEKITGDYFSKIVSRLASGIEKDILIKEAVEIIKKTTKSESGLIIHKNLSRNIFDVLDGWGYDSLAPFSFVASSEESEGLTGNMLYFRNPLLINDVEQFRIRPKYPEISEGLPLQSYLGIPITYENEILGAIVVTSSKKNAFNNAQQNVLERISDWLAIGLQNASYISKLASDRDYHEQIFETTLDAVIVADPHGKILQINQPALDLLGYQREEIKYILVEQLWESKDEARKIMGLMRENGGVLRDHFGSIKTKEQKIQQIVFSGAIIFENDGHVVKSTVGYFRKATEFEEIRTLLDHSRQIDRAIADSVTSLNLSSLSKAFLETISTILESDSLHIRLLDESNKFLDIVGAIGPYEIHGQKRKELGEDIGGKVVQTCKEIICQDASHDEYIQTSLDQNKGEAIESFLIEYQSYMVVPLIVSGDPIGSFHIESRTINFFNERRQALVRQIANRVAPILQSARLRAFNDKQISQLKRLSKYSRELLRADSIDSLFSLTVNQGKDLFHTESCSLYIVDNGKKVVNLVASSTLPPKYFYLSKPIGGVGLTAFVARTGMPLRFSGKEYKDSQYWEGKFLEILDHLPSKECLSLMLVPIDSAVERNQPPVGVLHLENILDGGKLQSFSDFDQEMLYTYANHFAGVYEQLKLRDSIQKQINQLLILQDASFMLQSSNLISEQLFYALIAITIGPGLGFNRAIIFLLDRFRVKLAGECAISPLHEEDAKRIYEDPFWESLEPRSIVETIFTEHQSIYLESPLNKYVKSLNFLLDSSSQNVLIDTLKSLSLQPKVFNSSDLESDEFINLLKDKSFEHPEFALVPMITQEKAIGVLYVDNKFSKNPISINLNLLSLFVNQLSAILSNTQILQEKERIFTDVAHTIGTPVTSISGAVERIIDGKVSDNELTEYYQIIARNSEFLKMCHKQSFQLHFFEQNEPLEFEWTKLAKIFEDILSFSRFMLNKRSITISINVGTANENIELFIHHYHMLTAFQMLVDNAIKFTEDDSKIEISTVANGNNLVVSIQDWGFGISETELPHIFDSGFRGKDSDRDLRGVQGTGIGLFLVNRVVSAHNCDILVQSEYGEGTKIDVIFPEYRWRIS